MIDSTIRLTTRQEMIMLAILKEFIASQKGVGSNVIVKKYNIEASSATIRSEMVKLGNLGLLLKAHVSSGRIPSNTAIRLYIHKVLCRRSPYSITLEKAHQSLFRVRFNIHKLTHNTSLILSKILKTTAFIVYHPISYIHGLSHIIKNTKKQMLSGQIIDLLLEQNTLTNLLSYFDQYYMPEYKVSMIFGKDTSYKILNDYAIVTSKFILFDNKQGNIGIISPRTINYNKAIHTVQYFGNILNNMVKGW